MIICYIHMIIYLERGLFFRVFRYRIFLDSENGTFYRDYAKWDTILLMVFVASNRPTTRRLLIL